MAQAAQSGWVDFQTIKAKLRFPQVLSHLGFMDSLDEKEEELTSPCPICNVEGFKVSLAKSSFSCPGCKKRGSVIDFVSAFKKVGVKEAGILPKDILEALAKSQIKEETRPGKNRRCKGKPGKETPASLSRALKEEIMAAARALERRSSRYRTWLQSLWQAGEEDLITICSLERGYWLVASFL